MPVNPLFNFLNSQNEQRLYDGITVESLRMYGTNCLYIPRNLTNYDQLYGTDEQSTYKDTYVIEMYIKNIMGFEGDKTFMSKFGGLEIRDAMTIVVAKTTFQQLVTPSVGYDRPQEGDLIFWPLNKKCFQVKFVNPFQMYYPLGALYVFEMNCELFEYSDETFNTGNPDIDIIQTKFSTNALDYGLLDENGHQLTTENGTILTLESFAMEIIDPTVDSELLLKKGIQLIDFTEKNPYSQSLN